MVARIALSVVLALSLAVAVGRVTTAEEHMSRAAERVRDRRLGKEHQDQLLEGLFPFALSLAFASARS